MTDKRQHWLTIAALASVGLLAADKLVLKPIGAHWEAQGLHMQDLREELDGGDLLLQREDVLRERWAEMNRDDLTGDASAAENEVLKAASRWAADSRILLLGLTPQWREFRKDGYRVLECRMTAQGNLSAIASFLRELETDPLAVRLEECEIIPRDDRGAALTLTARFSALQLTAEEDDRT
jgi:hypothetical protein